MKSESIRVPISRAGLAGKMVALLAPSVTTGHGTLRIGRGGTVRQG